MNTNKEINRAFNKHVICEVDNLYVPRIKSTVRPIKSTFNEIAQNIAKQLKKKYDIRVENY